MRENEYKKKQPVATTDTGTAEQTAQAVVTQAADEWNDAEREAGDAFNQATTKTANTPAVNTTDTDVAEDDANKTILDGFLKQQEALNKEKEQIDKQDPNTPEAIKKTRRRALIASIADGLSALSGMYFATKGAPATNNVVPTITEGIAKQNTADRNTYLELLQNWRKRNNELLNNYATYQATAAKNKLTQQRLAFEADKEARLWAKQKAQEAYNAEYLKLKKQGLDDNAAKWQAQLEQDKAELKALNDYRQQQIALGYHKASISAAPTVTDYEGVSEDGIYHITKKTQQKDLNNNANGK